jgi:hypothetical protein
MSIENMEQAYHYPYSSEVQGDFSAILSVASTESLGEDMRGPDGIYRRPGFDFTDAARNTTGPVIEIAGPSPDGYVTLRDGVLPSKPYVIDNIDHQRGLNYPPDDGVGLAVDHIADVRDLPIPDNSVGVMMASRIDAIDVGPFNKRMKQGGITRSQDTAGRVAEIQRLRALTQAALDRNNPAELPYWESPRLATIAQAARILEPGGVFIMNAVDAQDAGVARLLGLEIVMHTPVQPERAPRIGSTMMQEAVFQKPKSNRY